MGVGWRIFKYFNGPESSHVKRQSSMHILHMSAFLALSCVLSSVTAKLHHLFAGNLASPASIYAFTFETTTHTLKLTKNITAGASHPWIAFSPDKRNLYGTAFGTGGLFSYSTREGGNDLRLDAALQTPTKCRLNDTSAYIVPNPDHDAVYTAGWGGNPACYLTTSVLPNGTLDRVGESGIYTKTSGIHGLALHPSSSHFLYAADTRTDVIWTHSILPSGALSSPIPKNVSWDSKAPRHLATHPNGKWLYAVFEAGNSVSAYPLSSSSYATTSTSAYDGVPGNTTHRYSLLPGHATTSTKDPAPPLDERWEGAEITISPSRKLLWATTRAKSGSTNPGYITAFLLSPDGDIVERLFVQATTTKAGLANSVSVMNDNDQFVALTDWKGAGVGNGYLQIWEVEGLEGLEVKRDAQGKWERVGAVVGMKEVARVDVNDKGGCCANVVWYD
jgi:carboxy-cis,cis-muconate cyclase